MPNYQTMYISKDANTEEIIEMFGRLLHQLNSLMNNFDSKNIRSISTNKTDIKSDDGTTSLDGSQLVMCDKNGTARLIIGYSKGEGKFEFSLKNDNGESTLKISDTGNAVFKGEINASDISSSNISASNITASNITASDIDIDSDIKIGNNIYLGKNVDSLKKIHFFKTNDESSLTQAYIGAKKNDITEMTIMAGKISLNTLNDITVRRGLGDFKVVTTNMAPYIEIDGTKHYIKWE